MAPYETIVAEDRGAVRVLTLNQPKQFNPLDYVSGPELVDALERADRDPAVRAVVLTGAGRAFSGGGNVAGMRQALDEGRDMSLWFATLAGHLNRTIITLRRLSKPVVCAMNGVAAGGGVGWALACDLVVMADDTRFDPGYIRIAVNPDGGTSALVTRLIGHKRAAEFFMLGRAIKAPEALAWGLVNKLAPTGEVLAEALAMAQALAAGPREALASTKALLHRAALGDLETILEEERAEICRLSTLPEFAEGIAAFFDKRKPDFGGGEG